MKLYQKINEIRARIKIANPKKSGKNTFANFDYYELADFLPLVIELEKELNLTSIFTCYDNYAELKVVDVDSGETEIFRVPVREANMKGTLEIQKAGAEITYSKRYAYLNYLNLTENDQADKVDQKAVVEEKRTKTERNIILAEIEMLEGYFGLKQQILNFYKVKDFAELDDYKLKKAHERLLQEVAKNEKEQ